MVPPHTGLMATQAALQVRSGVDAELFSTDAAIEQAVRSILAESVSGNAAHVSAQVREGVVTLEGFVSDASWLARFKNKVTSAVPSVVIDDRLEWVVPDCGIGFA